jgi:GAF domain-containing protein
MSWEIATVGLALTALACVSALLWTLRQLAKSQKERRELQASSQILEQERHVLELIARGATLEEVLAALTQAVENIVPGVYCSVLLVDRDRRCLIQGAAPHLPPDFWKMCDGLPIIADFGCCPTAAFRNEMVISEDIGSDHRWAPVRDQVLGFGLESCWSVPIRDSETHQVIGTFAMYRNRPSKPTPFHVRAVEAGAQLAGNAIERLRAEQNLRDYAGRFALAEKVAAFGIWE